jgi:hypothetical protein
MHLVHVLEISAAKSGRSFQTAPASPNVHFIVLDMQGKIARTGVGEGHRDSRLHFLAPPKHRLKILLTSSRQARPT